MRYRLNYALYGDVFVRRGPTKVAGTSPIGDVPVWRVTLLVRRAPGFQVPILLSNKSTFLLTGLFSWFSDLIPFAVLPCVGGESTLMASVALFGVADTAADANVDRGSEIQIAQIHYSRQMTLK